MSETRLPDELEKKLNGGRVYRRMQLIECRAAEGGDKKKTCRGYATTFSERYTLYRDSEFQFEEQVDPHAFDECDMSDVIMQYDHRGRVYARTKNGTLKLTVDGHGLFCEADLSGTELGCQLYEEIKGGYTDKMSFGFMVAEDKREIIEDREKGFTTVIRTITKISKLYDVSAVSLPANDGTEISARSYCDGVIEELKAERLKAEEEKREREKLIELIKIKART